MLYFVRDGKYVKIGYTQDQDRLDRRLSALQAGNPRPLTLVALMRHGGPRTNSALRALFQPWWVGGEWFELDGPVKRTVQFVRSGVLPAEVVAYATKAVARSQSYRRKQHGTERKPRPRGRGVETDLTCRL